jgi:biopolymer transport protein ExbD
LVPQPSPADQPKDAVGPRTVVITVDSKHKFAVNSLLIDESQLGARLEEIFKTRAERVVFIQADASLDFAWVAKAIDVAHGAGIDKVGLMTALASPTS